MSATAPSLASGFVANNPSGADTTDDLVAATIAANAAQQEFDAPNPVPLETATGRVAKARAKKSPGSGAKRSEASKRKFICSFSHYGCDVALSSKNEWKRHVSIQHLQLGFYRCDVGSCNPDNNPNTPPSKKVYNDFNRKDLFTQHHRRMHKPDGGAGSATSNDQNSSDWRSFEDSLEEVRQRCWHEKRRPPQRSTCGFCARVFEGDGSWNERMEHVGGHYARDLPEACREEREDEDLTNWAIQEGVVKEAPNGRHVLVDQPSSSADRPFASRNIDAAMSDAPPISPTNGQMDGQFIGMDDTRHQSLHSSYPPLNGTGRPGSSSGQHYAPYPMRDLSLQSGYSAWQDQPCTSSLIEPVPNRKHDSDRLEDLINTLINPKKPRMSKRLQWRCDCGLDCAVDFAEDNPHDQRAFDNLGRISIICKNSQSPYLKTSKGEQYEIIPCDHLLDYITREGKTITGQNTLPKVEEMNDDNNLDDVVGNVDTLESTV